MMWRARIRRIFISWAASLTLLTPTTCSAAADEAAVPAVLELSNGDFVRGTLGRIRQSVLQWNAESFTQPLAFPLPAVRGMRLAPQPQTPRGAFLIELNNQDLLYGELRSIDNEFVQVETSQLGTVSLRREAVRRLSRHQHDVQMHRVPDRLDQWVTSDIEHWRSENRSLVTEKVAAFLFTEGTLPARAAIELELEWTGKPNFAFYLGTEQDQESRDRAFSIEVWGEHIIAQRRDEELADVAVLQKADTSSLHVHAYLDQPGNRLTIYGVDGTRLADLNVPVKESNPRSGMMLVNRGGNLRLKHLHVRGWSGTRPRSKVTTSVIVETGDATHACESLQLTPKAATVRLGSPDKEIPWADVQVVDFPTSNRQRKTEFVAVYQDGSRISGKLLSATDRTLHIRSHAADEPWRLSLETLRAFTLAEPSQQMSAAEPPENHRPGVLEMMDTRLHGWLVEQPTENEQASCLVWRAAPAKDPSPVRTNAYGRIVYREAPTKRAIQATRSQPANLPRPQAGAAGVLVRFGFVRQAAKQTPAAKLVPGPSAVHLRSGDAIPCKILGIDQQGVRIDSTLTDSRLIPHELVKAAQLADAVAVPVIEKTKRSRLLTLPRMQRHSPPLHLLFSPQGDVLRGTVRSLTNEELVLEIRLNPRRVPRSRVATIVWLHEDEMESQSAELSSELPTPAEASEMLVQVVSEGNRFSFQLEAFENQTVYGRSDVLQRVHAKVEEVDQLLLGGFIHRAARSLPYHRWRLVAAADPKFVQAAEEGAASESVPGMSSRLVGKPAPNIRLKMLDGGEDFQVTDHRGHCVVLDFWATWCGPCLQIMPQVEAVVAEFPSDEVQLVSINLEERPEVIRAVLERRGVNVPVALDRDGVAAIRYEAAAIPQTVVVDREGNVARVFVGTTPDFTEHLRAALTELIDAAPASP